MGLFPEFHDFFVSYGQYHDNAINKIIHVLCIPLLYFSLAALLQYFEWSCCNLDGSVGQGLYTVNVSFLFMVILAFLYLNVEFTSGIVSLIFYSTLYFAGRYCFLQAHATDSLPDFWQFMWICQLVGWGSQFIGHGLFEGRKPALMDNLLLTLVAPDFAVIEVMVYLGWKKDSLEVC